MMHSKILYVHIFLYSKTILIVFSLMTIINHQKRRFQGMDPHLQLMVLLSPFIKSIHSNLVLPAGSYSKSYTSAWIQASIRSQVEDQQAASDPQKELHDYLESPLEETSNPVRWWGLSSYFILFSIYSLIL